MGAAAIDERTLLKNAPTADGLESEYKELIDEARGDDLVFSGDGEQQGPVVYSSMPPAAASASVPAAAPTVTPAPPPASQPVMPPAPAAVSRPQREVRPIERFGTTSRGAPAAQPPSLTRSRQPTDKPKLLRVMVPQAIWPRHACIESDGNGWTAEVVLDTKERLGLRFVNAHDAAGRQWPLHYLRPEAVEAVPGDPEITSPALNVMCLQQHGLGYAVSVAPQQMCAMTLASWQEATMPRGERRDGRIHCQCASS